MSKTFSSRRCRHFATMMSTVLLLSFSSATLAIPISGDGALGDFQGSLGYSSSSSTTGTLTLSLTNTSSATNGGFITAFLLNNPDNSIDSISGTSFSDPDFGLLGLTDNGLNGAPNGQFDFGASTGSSYQGGGSPSGGIAVGDSATFTFNFTGTMLDALSAQSFIDELSVGTGAGEGFEWLVARFRGFDGGGSDKVPGEVPPTTAVPGPGGLLLLGLSLLGIGTFLRSRRS